MLIFHDQSYFQQVERALKIESYIHSEVTQAISEHCNCSFSMEFIRNGVFRCWNASNEVTYRSTIVGTKANNATQLVQFLQKWVNSEPVLLVEIFELWVDTKCPVRLSSFKLRGKGDCVGEKNFVALHCCGYVDIQFAYD